MKNLKRAAALTAALLILISLVVKPINASAAASAGAVITAGWVLDLALSGYATAEALELKDALDNGTIDNNVEQWLWDKASEWTYGYTQAQVEGKIYKAELTYGDLKALAALLSQAYPDGQLTTDRGFVVDSSTTGVFPIPLPLDTDIYFTDASQTGETADSICLYLYTSGTDLCYKVTRYSLPSAEIIKLSDSNLVTRIVADNITFNCSMTSAGKINTHVKTLFSNGTEKENDYYKDFIDLTKPYLITYSLPDFVPGVGVAGSGTADISDLIESLQNPPFGLTDEDVAVSIPITDDDTDVGDKTGTETGVDTSEIIENAPDVAVDGSFSNLKLPKTISSVFPFCLPFDFYNGIRLFSAQPVTPHFEIPVKIPIPKAAGGGYLCDETIVIDLSKYEKIGRLCRVTSTCVFLFFLIQLSTKIVKGAGA